MRMAILLALALGFVGCGQRETTSEADVSYFSPKFECHFENNRYLVIFEATATADGMHIVDGTARLSVAKRDASGRMQSIFRQNKNFIIKKENKEVHFSSGDWTGVGNYTATPETPGGFAFDLRYRGRVVAGDAVYCGKQR